METTRCFETAPEGSSLAACSLPAGHEGQHRAHFEHNPEGAFIEWSNEDCATLRARAEQAERERDEARAEVEQVKRERDEALQLAYIGEHRFPDLSWKARCEETVSDLRASQSQVKRLTEERDRLRGALREAVQHMPLIVDGDLGTRLRAALAGEASGEAKACGKRSVGGEICTRQAGHDGLHHCVEVVEGLGPMDVEWGVEAPEKAREP